MQRRPLATVGRVPVEHDARLRHRGFTLIEVIVVVAVLSILASIAVPIALQVEVRAQEEAVRAELKSIGEGVFTYFEAQGSLPASLSTLETAGLLGSSARGDSVSVDPWGRAYSVSRSGMVMSISSVGADGASGTADDISYDVNATPLAVKLTLEEMTTIHNALQQFEVLRLAGSVRALPTRWATVRGRRRTALRTLTSLGYLPNSTKYQADAWGNIYTFSGSPSTVVTSPGLTSLGITP